MCHSIFIAFHLTSLVVALLLLWLLLPFTLANNLIAQYWKASFQMEVEKATR